MSKKKVCRVDTCIYKEGRKNWESNDEKGGEQPKYQDP